MHYPSSNNVLYIVVTTVHPLGAMYLLMAIWSGVRGTCIQIRTNTQLTHANFARLVGVKRNRNRNLLFFYVARLSYMKT